MYSQIVQKCRYFCDICTVYTKN